MEPTPLKTLDSAPSAEDSSTGFEQAFWQSFEKLASTLALAPSGRAAGEAVRDRLVELEALTHPLIRHDLDRGNVRFTLLAVAAYDVLRSVLAPEESMAGVEDCLVAPLRPWVLAGTRRMLDDAPDPFAALVAVSKQRERAFFGPSFEFERLVDDGYGYVLNVNRCLFHEVLKACDRLELQPLLCRVDLNWIEAIEPERHRFCFVRPSTLVNASVCRMWFMRLETLRGGRIPRKLPRVDGSENR